VDKCLYQPEGWQDEIREFLRHTSANLLKKACQRLPQNPSDPSAKVFEVDIIRDVIIPLHTRFIAELFALPIKTTETSPRGIYTEKDLYGLLTAMFAAVFFNGDPVYAFKLRTLARESALDLEKLVRLEAEVAARACWLTRAISRLRLWRTNRGAVDKEQKSTEWPSLPSYGRQLLSRMMQRGKTVEECVACTVMSISTVGTTMMSVFLSQCLDYFLGSGNAHLPELYRLAHAGTVDADAKLLH
jgi:hypothetical protein